MHNRIFGLMSQHLDSFNNTEFKTTKKTATDGDAYYFVEPKEVKADKSVTIPGTKMTVKKRHFTVFEKLKARRGAQGEAAYHLTMELEKDGAIFIARLYYDASGKRLYINCKDQEGNIIALGEDLNQIENADTLYTSHFINTVANTYNKQFRAAEMLHAEHLAKLTEISKQLVKPDSNLKTVWENYGTCLDQLIPQLEAWCVFHRHPEKIPLKHFKQLREHARKQYQIAAEHKTDGSTESKSTLAATAELAEAKVDTAVTTVVVKQDRLTVINKELVKIKESKELLSCEKIVREFALISEKVDLVQDNDGYLDCIVRLRELEALANKELTGILMLDAKYEAVTVEQQEALIQLIPNITHFTVHLAVINERPDALKLLLKYQQGINLNTFVNNTALTLLDEAYQNNDMESVRVLVAAGADVDQRNFDTGCTLLMKACQDKREDMIEVFLECRALFLAKCYNGYSAWGYLTLTTEEPDVDLLETFLSHCKSSFLMKVDYLQGVGDKQTTALAYACEHNFLEAAKCYLKHGAVPTAVRLSDTNTPLSLCAKHNNEAMLTLLLNDSQHDVAGGLAGAEAVARKYGHTQIEAMVKKARGGKEDREIRPEFVMPIGTSLEDMFAFIGLHTKPQAAGRDTAVVRSKPPGKAAAASSMSLFGGAGAGAGLSLLAPGDGKAAVETKAIKRQPKRK